MSMSDTLGDMLTRIRNGQSANKEVVEAPASRFRGNVLDVLKREGYIRNFSKFEKRPGIHEFKIELKYYEGKPVISEIKRVSTPGRRVYSSINDLPRTFSAPSKKLHNTWSISQYKVGNSASLNLELYTS